MSLIEQYGPCIRDIFKVNRSPNAVLQPMEQALGTIDNAKTLLVIVTNAAQAPSTHVFHQLFVIRRARSVGDLALCDNHLYAVDVKSRTVFVSLMQTHLRLSLHSAKVIFTLARSSGIESNSLAVWAFEKITNHYLASGSGRNGRRASLIFCAQMKALNDSHFFHCSWDAPDDELVVSSWAVRVEASNNQPKSISLKHELPLSPRDIIHYHELPRQFSNDKYYIPVQKNNPLFDAFFISAGDTGKSILWVVQTTMAAQHGGSEDGYSIIETIRERLGGDCAVKYVLLVPWQKQRAYRWEMPNGWEAIRVKCTSSTWIWTLLGCGNLIEYVFVCFKIYSMFRSHPECLMWRVVDFNSSIIWWVSFFEVQGTLRVLRGDAMYAKLALKNIEERTSSYESHIACVSFRRVPVLFQFLAFTHQRLRTVHPYTTQLFESAQDEDVFGLICSCSRQRRKN